MSYNGSGTFLINSAGQPVVANTVISATVFNSLTADLATGLSTAITKDGQTTVTANIPFGNNKITTLGAGTAATDAANLGQVQSTAAKLITVTGTDTITGSMSPQLTAYAAGQLLYFIANAANTGAVTINVDGLGAKAITRDGSTALAAGDINSGEVVVIVYDGTRFQMINAANSFGNTTINGTLTVTGNTGLQANVSITSALSVGGTFNVTGAATLGSTLSVTGKSDLPTVSTASINAAVALITTGTVTNLTATGASIASANIGNLQFTAASIASINAGVAVVTNLTATSASIASANVGTAVITTGTVTNLTSTSASIASMNAGVALLTTATVTNLTATGASVASANVGTAVVTGLTVTGASIASVNAGVAVLSGNLTLSGGTANGVLYLNGSKVATSGSALVFDGTNLGIGTASPSAKLHVETSSGLGAFIGNSDATNGFGLKITAGGSASSRYALHVLDPTDTTSYLIVSTATGSVGNVGIGTTSPANKLDVAGPDGSVGTIKWANGGGRKPGFLYSDSAGVAIYDSNLNDAGIYLSGNTQIDFRVNGSQRAIIDSSGNLGLGVTPSAWGSAYNALQMGNGLSLFSTKTGTPSFYLSSNAYFDTGYKYQSNGFASEYYQFEGTHVWRTAASGTAGNAITFTQAMTLDASGNLGLGTTSLLSFANYTTLRVGGSSTTIGLISAYDGTTDMRMSTANNGIGYVGTNTNHPVVFVTNATERARITADGYFKASNDGTYQGSTSAYHELRQSAAGVVTTFFSNKSASNPYGITVEFTAAAPDNNTEYFFAAADNVTTRCLIYSDGDLANHDGVYGTISDARLKQDIADAPSQWDDLKAIRFRKYRMKTDVEANPDAPALLGVVAQELEQVCPGLVDEHPDMEMVEVTDGEGNVTQTQQPTGTTTKTVKSSILLMKAAVALQEAMARIEKLEAEVAAMKGVA